MLKDNVKKATAYAISGPNQLVLSFEKRYDLARKYCERSDNLNRLRETAAQLAGKPVSVTFRQSVGAVSAQGGEISAAEGATSSAPPKAATPEVKGKADPFVLKAAEIFHGKVGEGTLI
jgi:hypothetical protein